MDIISLGQNLGRFEPGLETLPYSRVDLLDSNGDLLHTAGDDTGRTLEAVHPDATQEMADSILASIQGFVYRPYEAQDALLDPAAELGDGVTMDGVRSLLGHAETRFDRLCTSDIRAPITDEIDDEYPYKTPLERMIERNIQSVRSYITKTAEEISLAVENLDEQLGTTLRVGLDGVTITNATGEAVTISGGQIDASTINAAQLDASQINASQINASQLDASQINVGDLKLSGAISWDDLNDGAKQEIGTTASEAGTEAASGLLDALEEEIEAVKEKAEEIDDTISPWIYSGSTYIDGGQIMTGTVTASSLRGGEIALMDSDGGQVGIITLVKTQSYALDITSDLALRLNAASGQNAYVGTTDGPYLLLGNGRCSLGGGALCLTSESYGSSLPKDPVNGQVYFLIASEV